MGVLDGATGLPVGLHLRNSTAFSAIPADALVFR
jgi:hypothetical protein